MPNSSIVFLDKWREAYRENHWFWSEFKTQLPLYKWAALAALLANIFAFVVSLFAMVVYDRVLPNQAIESLASLAIGALIFLILDYITRQVRSTLLDTASIKIDEALNAKLFDEIILAENPQKTSSGSTASIVKEFDTLKEFIAAATITTFIDIPFALLFLAAVWLISGALVLVPLLSIIALCAIGYIAFRRSENASANMMKIGRTKHGLLIECLNAREFLSNSAARSFFKARWQQSTDLQASAGMESKEISNQATNLVNFVNQFNQIATVSAGVIFNSMVGSLVAVTLLGGRAIAPFSQVVNLLSRFSQAKQSFLALDQLFAESHKSKKQSGILSPNSLNGSIEFINVSAHYPNSDVKCLNNVSFRLQAGDRLGILGRTGSGKTSLLRALMGQLELEDGKILFGGVDIRELEPLEYRSAYAVVFQENYVFKGSLASNIAMSDGPFDAQKLQAAAQKTGFSKVIQGLNNGFMAETSERGETLSGGQRRLLALTRAVYQEFTHLLLDEPSSGLDAITERDLLQALASGLVGKTLLFTTHRPAPIGLASKLLVIESGLVQHFGDRDVVLQALRSENPA